MTNVITAPEGFWDRNYDILSVFLAGTIDNGASEDWQTKAAYLLSDSYIVFNPRRKDWNGSASYEDVRAQARWEMDAMDQADFILMNFLPSSKSPITLAELGLYGDTGKLHVVCPEGFYRKANVDEICERYGIPQHKSLDEAIEWLIENGEKQGFNFDL